MPTRAGLFLDASVLLAAAASPGGSSALVLELCKAGRAVAVVTRLVLREAERNIQAKLNETVLLRFYGLMAELEPRVVPLPGEEEIEATASVVAAKDAHVPAAARTSRATHVVTLDRKHFLSRDMRQAILPIVACTPGEFLQEMIAGNV